MSTIAYRGIELEICKTNDHWRNTIRSKDGVAFELVQWMLDVDCIYSPSATAYVQRDGTNTFLPTARKGTSAPLTDIALRDWLAQPRGQLVYTVGGQVLLSTPAPGYSSDALYGPIVERCKVLYLGERTFAVSLRIVAHVNEGPRLNVARQPGAVNLAFRVLLSNRWRQWVQQDRDFMATLVTQGVARFRTDELLKRGQVPDNYRAAVLPPIPKNFTRAEEKIVPTEDGAELHYEVTDREQFFNMRPQDGCTRLEVYVSRTLEHPNAFEGLARGLTTTFPDFIEAASHRWDGESRGLRALRVVTQGVRGVASLGGHVFPLLVAQASAKAWGAKGSFRRFLAAMAVGCCFGRLGFLDLAQLKEFVGIRKLRMTYEASGKYVEFDMMVMQPYIGVASNMRGDDGGPIVSPFGFILNMPNFDATPPYLNSGENIINLAPPNSSGTRGSWNNQVAAAPLPSVHADPPAWPDLNAGNTDATPP